MASRVALVTGGNRGIGLQICRQLVYKKWKVIMTTRNLDSAHTAIQDEFDDEIFPKQNVDVLQLDITDADSIRTASEYIKQAYDSRVNVLVNNAGIAFAGKQWSEEVIDDTLNTNLYGTVNLTKALCPFITDRIFFISSRAGALQQYSKQRQQHLLRDDLTEEQLFKTVEEFRSDAKCLKLRTSFRPTP